MVALVWFRQDLRVSDNPALAHAAKAGAVVPVYVLDDVTDPARPIGGAGRWWLHQSLAALEQKLGGLVVRRSDPGTALAELAEKTNATAIT